MKILVIKQTSLGDVLHATGHICVIRQKFPNAHIVALTATESAPLYRHHPDIDEVIEFDRHRLKANPGHGISLIRTVIKDLRRHRFDIAIDLQGLFRSVVFLYGANAFKKVVKGRYPFLHGFSDTSMHAIDEMSEVLKIAGIDCEHVKMNLPVAQDAIRRIDERLGNDDLPFVVISPYSRHEAKDWPLSAWESCLEKLLVSDAGRFRYCVTGAASRTPELRAMTERLDHPRIVNLAGQLELMEFVALIKRAVMVMTGDSFPMHAAAAAGTPLFAIFGPTHEQRIGPRGDGPYTIIRAQECDGCTRPRKCKRRCLNELSADDVFSSVLAFTKKLPA